MPDTTRTFIALEIPADKRDKLGRLQSLIAPEIPGARWVEMGQFHVTLAFLGDVPHADLAGLCRAVAGVAAGHAPIDLRLEGLGVFPDPRRARVAWVGLAGPGLEALGALQRDVAAAANRAGYPPDERFSPHVTIGRLKIGRGADPPPDLSPLLRHYQRWMAGSFQAAEVVTFASNPTPDGPAYAALARAPLAGGKPQPSP